MSEKYSETPEAGADTSFKAEDVVNGVDVKVEWDFKEESYSITFNDEGVNGKSPLYTFSASIGKDRDRAESIYFKVKELASQKVSPRQIRKELANLDLIS